MDHEEGWDVIPSIDCVDEHLQDSFDFYAIRVPDVGRRVRRADISKVVWSVSRVAVAQADCAAILNAAPGGAAECLTITQCERVIRAVEMTQCDEFLRRAEAYLRKAPAAAPTAAPPGCGCEALCAFCGVLSA